MASNPVRSVIAKAVRAVAGERGVRWVRRFAGFMTGHPIDSESEPVDGSDSDGSPEDRQ